MPQRVAPLNINMQITDAQGRPTPEFMRWWTDFLAIANPLTTPGGVSNLIDLIGNTRGSLLIRGENAWALLVPSTAGRVLVTQGPGADPIWQDNTLLNLTDTPATYTGQAGRVVAVNATEDGVEFIQVSAVSAPDEYLVTGTTASGYETIQDAIDAVNAETTGPTFDNPFKIKILTRGLSMSAGVTIPQFVSVVAESCRIEFTAASGSCFTLSGFNRLYGLEYVGGNASNTDYFIDSGNTTDNSIFECNLYGNNVDGLMKFVRCSGATWARVNIERCLVNYRGTTGYHTVFENTGSTRFVDAWVNDCFFDAYANFTSPGGNISVEGTGGVEDLRVRRSTIRGNDADYRGLNLSAAAHEVLIHGNNFDSEGDASQLGFDVNVGSGATLIDADANSAKRTNIAGTLQHNDTIFSASMGRVARFVGTSANLDIPFILPGVRKYVICGRLSPVNDGVNLLARTTTDNFATVTSSPASYDWIDDRKDDTGASATNQSNSATEMRLATNLGNALNEYWAGDIHVYHPRDNSWSTAVRAEAQRINSSGAMNSGLAAGRRASVEDNDGIRLFCSAGNIEYDVTVYAYR